MDQLFVYLGENSHERLHIIDQDNYMLYNLPSLRVNELLDRLTNKSSTVYLPNSKSYVFVFVVWLSQYLENKELCCAKHKKFHRYITLVLFYMLIWAGLSPSFTYISFFSTIIPSYIWHLLEIEDVCCVMWCMTFECWLGKSNDIYVGFWE